MTRADALHALTAAINRWSTTATSRPLVVAIDGRGASGKTTLAASLTQALGVAVLHTDDYFRPAPATAAASGPPREQDAIVSYYDLARLRARALEPLLAAASASTVIVEGVSSSSEALADLVDRSVLVRTPAPERLARLHELVAPEEWDEDWLAAERRYFRARPAASFDLVVSGSAG